MALLSKRMMGCVREVKVKGSDREVEFNTTMISRLSEARTLVNVQGTTENKNIKASRNSIMKNQ